jgi:hypothetical protein
MPEPAVGQAQHKNEHVLEEDNRAWILIMHVMIKFADGVEFQNLCLHYLGQRAEFVQDFVMATAPGTGDRMCIYRIDDDTALATWISMARPNWIDRTGSWYQYKEKEKK